MELYDEQGNVIRVEEKKAGWWEKFGGTSFIIAALFHVVLLLIGGFWILKTINEPDIDKDIFVSTGNPEFNPSEYNVKNKTQGQPMPLPASARRVIVDGVSTYTIPEQGTDIDGLSSLPPLSNNSGMNGPGIAGGPKSALSLTNADNKVNNMFPPIELIFSKRCSKEDRLSRLKSNGGTPACEDAVLNGLRWLKDNQNDDGSWGPQKNAMTGLVLLAYFGHCETPKSTEFGDSCQKAILYLVDYGMKNDGKLSGSMAANAGPYEHAIATYALAEAATFCKQFDHEIPSLTEVTEKAGQYIIDNQHESGGWAYGYSKADNAHNDSSVVGWQLQALKACSHTDIKFKGMDTSAKKGLKYLATCQAPDGSFGYTGPGGRTSLTGVGVLCHQMWGEGKSKEAREGVKFIKKNFKLDWKTADSDLYSHYYASQAMMHAGGSDWKSYNIDFRDQLLNNQNSDGSWKAPAFSGHGQSANSTVYNTTLCVLMLEVYYRFLNSSGGGNARSSNPEIE
jgi:hypothetical protein